MFEISDLVSQRHFVDFKTKVASRNYPKVKLNVSRSYKIFIRIPSKSYKNEVVLSYKKSTSQYTNHRVHVWKCQKKFPIS